MTSNLNLGLVAKASLPWKFSSNCLTFTSSLCVTMRFTNMQRSRETHWLKTNTLDDKRTQIKTILRWRRISKVKTISETRSWKKQLQWSLEYNPNASKPQRRKRQRKVIWYNPPFSLSVKTNIGYRIWLAFTWHWS